MLIRYTVENYKSIKDEVTLSMEAYTRDRKNKNTIFNVSRDLKILPLACIYGANASGKTNILESMHYLRFLVTRSGHFQKKDAVEPNYFKFDDVSRDRVTRFSIDFINEGLFNYSLSVLHGKVTEESLSLNKKLLFRRTEGYLDPNVSISEEEKKKMDFIMGLTNDNSLLLSKCSESNITLVENAYNWFDEKLFFTRAGSSRKINPERMKDAISKHGSKLIDVLNRADLGISNISVKESDDGKHPERILKFAELANAAGLEVDLRRYEFTVEHDITSDDDSRRYTLDMDDESDGTQKMARMTVLWLDALESGGILIVDELEACLHPHLADLLIEYITEPDLNLNGAQLMFTTHDASIAKRNKFRRDQIWFTSREPTVGVTNLYSLLDYEVRPDLEFTENYLAGRFGAVPHVRKRDVRE
ncbi:MAG: ATP-binding protein [Methanomassiliicoccaceae archaeon]|nr:ATP-binding protein [Methanomassiliicoccaceae archaeon]